MWVQVDRASAWHGAVQMRCRPRLLVPALVVFILLVLGGRDRPAAQTLAIGLARPAVAGDHTDAVAFGSLVEGLSIGAIEIDIYGGRHSCGTSAQCVRALHAGEIDVVPATTDDLVRLFPELQVLDLPYLFESDAVVERVFAGPFYARLRDAIAERTGLRLMAISPRGGWRSFASAGRRVQAPNDVQGLTLWTAGSPVEASLVAAFGGSPTDVPLSQLAAAFATGTIHGVTLSVTDVVATGLHEQIDHVTLDRHSRAMTLWLIDDDRYRELPAHLQQVVQASFDEVSQRRRGLARERLAEALSLFEASGAKVHTPTPDERREFLMAAGRVSTEYMDAYGADWLVWLEGAIAAAEAEIRSVTRAGGRGTAASAGGARQSCTPK